MTSQLAVIFLVLQERSHGPRKADKVYILLVRQMQVTVPTFVRTRVSLRAAAAGPARTMGRANARTGLALSRQGTKQPRQGYLPGQGVMGGTMGTLCD